MRLVKFTQPGGGEIYINPDNVEAVYNSDDGEGLVDIITPSCEDGEYYTVKGSLKSVVKMLMEE